MSKLDKAHSRCKIRLETAKEVEEFVSRLNTDGTIDKYFVEDFDCQRRVDARSYLGMIYASSEFAGETYLVNSTEDGKYPKWITDYMIY